MGRRSVVAGDEFLPGMTLDELRRLMKEEKDPRNVPRYLVAYSYKAGRTIKEIADFTGENPETVRRWIATARKMGPKGIPRRIAKGGERLLTRRQRAALVKDVHKGPRALGYKTDVWTYKDLWLHAKKRFNVKISYAAAVRNFHEMGIVLKTPRPRHPKAASEEERADFQRETRAVILKYARQGFVIISGDEAHIQAYCNTCKTLGLRSRRSRTRPSNGPGRVWRRGGGLFLPQGGRGRQREGVHSVLRAAPGAVRQGADHTGLCQLPCVRRGQGIRQGKRASAKAALYPKVHAERQHRRGPVALRQGGRRKQADPEPQPRRRDDRRGNQCRRDHPRHSVLVHEGDDPQGRQKGGRRDMAKSARASTFATRRRSSARGSEYRPPRT